MRRSTATFLNRENVVRGYLNSDVLRARSKGDLSILQRLSLEDKLQAHNGCVNTISWNESGNLILSGSDDQHIAITNPYSRKTNVSIHSGHRANIFSAKFLPYSNDLKVISCSGDGILFVTHIDREETYGSYKYDCHFGTVYEVLTIPNDSHTFLSCGEDGTVRWFDMRIKDKCIKSDCREDVLISCRGAVSAISLNPMAPYQLAVGCSDSTVRLFDRRVLGTTATGNINTSVSGMFSCFTAPGLEKRTHRVTSIEYGATGQELLISYSSEYLYLFDMTENTKKIFSTSSDDRVVAGTSKNGNKNISDGTDVQPPIKRLRLRGDWSDTGPCARPESERQTDGENRRVSLMQRMSEMLTRWFEDRVQQEREGDVNQNESTGANSDAVNSSLNEHDPANEDSPQVVQGQRPQDGEILNAIDEEGVLALATSSTIEHESLEVCADSRLSVISSYQVHCDNIGSSTGSFGGERTSAPGLCADQIRPDAAELDWSSVKVPQSELPCNRAQTDLSNHEPEISENKASETRSESSSSVTLPVISLEYNPLGVNNSTVTVGFESQRGKKTHNKTESDLTTSKYSTVQSCNSNKKTDASGVDTSQIEEENVVLSDLNDGAVGNNFVERPPNNSTSMQEGPRAGSSRRGNIEVQAPRHCIDSDDDESEDDSQHTTQYRSRHASEMARKIQRLYRKRQEEKRLEEEASRNNWQPRLEQVFKGHRNARTMIKEANFWGDQYVMSGSDCGHIFFWDRKTGKLVNLLEADKHVVNCIQPHPLDPILASSGIDYDIKLWSPISPVIAFDAEEANELMTRNEVMLEETRDTITVPASFMLRMLASLNHIRSGRRSRHEQNENSSSDDDRQ